MVSPGKAFALEKLRRGSWEAGNVRLFAKFPRGAIGAHRAPGGGGGKMPKIGVFLLPTPGGRILAGIPPWTNYTNREEFTISRVVAKGSKTPSVCHSS